MRIRFFLLALCMSACASTEERPKDLLPRDKFTEVLLESQLIEARVNQEMVIDKRTDAPAQQYYKDMFAAQGVSVESFKTTFKWYVDHPAELKDIYNEVLTGLQKRVDLADSTGSAH